jgi:hypothetical protein
MTWQIVLIGEDIDIAEIRKLAPVCDCAVGLDPDGHQCLSLIEFAASSSPQDVQAEGRKRLTRLNGLARLSQLNHHPVQLGQSMTRVDSDGRRDAAVSLTGVQTRARAAPLGMIVTRTDSRTEEVVHIDKSDQRNRRIIDDPKLTEIVEAIAGDINWQKLRVAFEKISALVGKGDNSLVQAGYASQEEICRFKANVEDPRVSGLNAVHGVPRGPEPRGTQMHEQDGLAFIVGLLHGYVDRLIAAGT